MPDESAFQRAYRVECDAFLKDMYNGALADLNRPLLFDTLYIQPVDITPHPYWVRLLISAKERLNSCYMHLRYGACDDQKEWYNHDCY